VHQNARTLDNEQPLVRRLDLSNCSCLRHELRHTTKPHFQHSTWDPHPYITNMDVVKPLISILSGLLWTSTFASFGLHPTSSKWDHQTTMTVEAIRAIFCDPRKSISKLQKGTTKDRVVKGKIWAPRVSVPKPTEQTFTDVIFQAIDDMGDGMENYTRPDAAGFEAEWVGSRANASDGEQAPPSTEREKYGLMMGEKTRTSSSTVLYLHGGEYYLCGLDAHRETARKLVKACDGRVLLIEYRLAPQTAFPGQLIDALNAYLYLLYPPAGSFMIRWLQRIQSLPATVLVAIWRLH
jgi:hypothetical protein